MDEGRREHTPKFFSRENVTVGRFLSSSRNFRLDALKVALDNLAVLLFYQSVVNYLFRPRRPPAASLILTFNDFVDLLKRIIAFNLLLGRVYTLC